VGGKDRAYQSHVPQNRHLDEALAVAAQIARMDADAVAITKQSINRTFEIMGLREALRANLDLAVQIENLETPERRKFQEITRQEGLKAAICLARRPFRTTRQRLANRRFVQGVMQCN
jgi:hypothetical protein